MNIEEVREYALSLPGTTEDQAYGEDWVLFRVEGKIFLHIWLNAPQPTCAVKLPPEQGQTLRDHYDGIRPAYHLNKVHWNDIFLDEIDDDMVKVLINQSYRLVLSKLPKRLREKYGLKKMNTSDIDTTNMCSHLRHKLMDADGLYHHVWQAIQDDPELTAVVRSRQLHIYRNGKKVLVLKGKAEPQIVRDDPIDKLIK